MTKREPEYAERLYTSSLRKAAEAPHPADRHGCWFRLLCGSLVVAVVLLLWWLWPRGGAI